MIDTNYNGLSIYEKTGFIGLNVIGRKTINVDIYSRENAKDGTTFQKKRLPERELIVQGFIEADSEEELLEKYDALIGFLVKDPVQIIFSDEPDKYFVGMYKAAKIAKEGRTANTTELYFNCNDPHKYSLYRKEFTEANGGVIKNADGTISVLINNEGTVDCPIDYEITMNHESGYIGIASDHGAMEYGNIEEADVAQGQKSELLLNLGNGSQIRNAFKAGVNPITTGAFNYNGSVAVEGNWLKLNSAGSGSSWHGAGGQIDIPADSMGSRVAKNFRIAFRPFYATHKTYAVTGDLEIVVGDEQGNLLCDVHLAKDNVSNNYANAHMKIAGHGDVFKLQYEPRSDYGITNENGMEVWFGKAEDLFSICWNGRVYQYRFPELKEKKAKTVNVFFGCYAGTNPMTYLRLLYLTFAKDNVAYYYDLPNRYQSGNVLKIDGAKGAFYVNGNPRMQDEVIGSTYFKAKAGDETEAILSVSSFCTTKPTVKAWIREAWL